MLIRALLVVYFFSPLLAFAAGDSFCDRKPELENRALTGPGRPSCPHSPK